MTREDVIKSISAYVEENGYANAWEAYRGAQREFIEKLADRIVSTRPASIRSTINAIKLANELGCGSCLANCDQYFPDYSDNDPIICDGAYYALIKYLQ